MKDLILIVEKDKAEREAIKSIFSADYEVIESKNTKEMISVLDEHFGTISAIILNLKLSEKDGFDAIKKVNENATWKQIPIIAVGDESDEDMQNKAMAAGASGYIGTEYNPKLALHMIRNTILLYKKTALIKWDMLTKILNRESFIEIAEDMISRKEKGYYILSCLDVENFKVINDQYGTEKGDEVLKNIARDINSCVLSLGGICCRFMADKFGVLFPAKEKDSQKIRRCHARMTEPKTVNHKIRIRIGRYVVDDPTIPVSAMYDRATLAEESIKGKYGTYISEYNDEMRINLLSEQQMVNNMNDALAKGQFLVWLQPQYNHIAGTMIGAEALVRWKKDGIMISPADFIPVFERNGFIYELDQYVWENVCKLIRRWLDEKRKVVPISVNISRRDLLHRHFISVFTGIVSKYNIPYDLLRLEVTESAFAEASKQIINKVNKLIEIGFTVEIDDFGSGYSSLNTLKDVSATILKLDMKFFENTKNSQRSGNIIESVVRMAKWLGMTVIAEGVENKVQADYLKSIGCYYIQGFYYAKPVPSEKFEKLADEKAVDTELAKLKTVKTLNNSEFWNPKSMETLIFNSYVGGACIFEYHNGKTELLRVNERYSSEFGKFKPDEINIFENQSKDFLDDENRKELHQNIDRAIDTGKESVCELKLCRGGNTEFIRATVRVIATSDDRYLFYCVVVNITEQQLARQMEIETADKLKTVLNHIGNGITAVVLREDTAEFLFANDRYYEILGYKREEYNKQKIKNATMIIYPDDRDRVNFAACEARRTRKSQTVEYRIFRADGNIVWIRTIITVTKLAGIDAPVQIGVFSDITEEKEANDQLEFLNESARDILAQPDTRVAMDTTLKRMLNYFDAERAYVVEIDYEKKTTSNTYEICADGIKSEKENLQKIPFADEMFWFKTLQKDKFVNITNASEVEDEEVKKLLLAQNISSLILAPLWKDGVLSGFVGIDNPKKYANRVERLKAIGDYIEILLTHRDFDETRKELLNNLPCGAALYEYDGKNISVIHINRRYWELVGREPKDYSKTSVLGAVYKDDVYVLFREIDSAIRQNRDIVCDVRIRYGKDGYKPFHIVGTFVMQGSGKYTFYVAYSPISKSKMAIQEMIPIALSTMMESSNDFAFVKDKDLYYICCTKSVAKLMGRHEETEIIGKSDFDLFDRNIAERISTTDESIITSGKSIIDMQEVIHREDGKSLYVKTSKYPLMNSKGEVIGIYGVSQDITEAHEAKSRLSLLTDSIPGGIASYEVKNHKARLIYCNDRYYNFSGYSKEEYFEMSKKDPFVLVLDEDRAGINEKIKEIAYSNDKDRIAGGTCRRYLKDGGFRWFSVKCSVSWVDEEKYLLNIVLIDITEQRSIEQSLRLSEEEYRLATLHSSTAICKYNVTKRILTLERSMAEKFNLPERMEDMPYSRVRLGVISDETSADYIEFYEKIHRGCQYGEVTFQKLLPAGWRWLKAKFSSLFDNDGKPVSAIISYVDITEQNEKEAIYRKWQQSLQDKPDSLYTLYRYDLSRNSFYGNQEGTLINWDFSTEKLSFDECTRKFAKEYVYEGDKAEYINSLKSDKLLGEYYRGVHMCVMDFRIKTAAGKLRWLKRTVDLVQSHTSNGVIAYIMYEDIDDEKKKELETKALAERDPLTGLLNRKTFAERMDNMLSKKREGSLFALFILDMDGFKQVNDTFGHAVGDKALVGIGNTISSVLRGYDLVGRLGGDEFVVCICDVPNVDVIRKKARQICMNAHKRFRHGIELSVSLGIAVCPNDAGSFEELYQKADRALYRVKESGKDGYAFYDEAMNQTDNEIAIEKTEQENDAERLKDILENLCFGNEEESKTLSVKIGDKTVSVKAQQNKENPNRIIFTIDKEN